MVLKEVASCTVFVLPVVSLVDVVVLKEVVSCAIFCISVPVVLCVLILDVLDSICIETG